MKQLRTVSAVALITLAIASVSQAESDDWKMIFDGTSLEGWKPSEEPIEWVIEDGALRTPPGRNHLYYVAEEFQNFELFAEVMTTPGSNSGIFFHTKYQADGWPTHGYESQVNQTHVDPVRTGSLYNVVKLFTTPVKDNEWYEQRVRVEGKNIRVQINGEVVIDYTEPEGVTATRRLSKGLIALQGHDPDSVVYYRNIRVRKIR